MTAPAVGLDSRNPDTSDNWKTPPANAVHYRGGPGDAAAAGPKERPRRSGPPPVEARGVTPWTWERIERAAASTSGWRRTRQGEWRGPCKCGGERDRAWIRSGRGGAVLAGCNAGCPGPDVIGWLTGDVSPRMARAFPPGRSERPRPRPVGHPKAPGPLEADSGRFRVVPAATPKNETPGSPRIADRDATRPPVPPDSGPQKPDRAARLWMDSRAVPLDPAHPARLWAARRHLWRPADPWPEAVRWLAHPDGGSLVAAFAPVDAWIEAHPPGVPPGVQLVHVAPDGSPRKDRDGLGKRSHGTMRGAVAVIGDPLWRAGCVHVAEGLADALAVAAREDGAALAAGGTALSRLAPSLAGLGLGVVVWPDGDGPGRLAAGRLVADLRRRGAAAALATVPDGKDPAAMAAPFTPCAEKAPDDPT